MALQPLAQGALTVVGMVWITFQDRSDAGAARGHGRARFSITRSATTPRYIQPRLLHVKGMEADALSIVHDAMSMVPVVSCVRARRSRAVAFPPPRRRHAAGPRRHHRPADAVFAVRQHDDSHRHSTGAGLRVVPGTARTADARAICSSFSRTSRQCTSRSRRSATRSGRSRTISSALRMAFHVLDTKPHHPRDRRAPDAPRSRGPHHVRRRLVQLSRPSRTR